MNDQHKGRHSFCPQSPPTITAWASTAGKKESEGPLSKTFDHVFQDNIKVKNKDSGGIEQYLFAFICGGIIVFSIAIIVIVFVIQKKKNAK